MTETVLVPVSAHEVGAVWTRVQAMIAAATAESSGRYTPVDVRRALFDRRMQLWCAMADGNVKAVCVTEILDYPSTRAASVVLLTGHERAEWLQHLEGLKHWAKAEGCALFEAWARPGWERVMRNMRKTHVLLECDLGDERAPRRRQNETVNERNERSMT